MKIQGLAALITFTGAIAVQGAHADDVLMGMFQAQGTEMLEFARTTSLNAAVKRSGRDAGSRRSTRALRFQPDPGVSKQVKSSVIQSLYELDDAVGRRAERVIRQQDVIADFRRDMQPYGLKPNNLADAMTAYWATMWMISNQAPVPTAKAVRAARAQLAEALLSNHELVRSGDDVKQTIAESLVYETMLALGIHANATRSGVDTPEYEALAQTAHENFESRGFAMRDIRLTSVGFQPR